MGVELTLYVMDERTTPWSVVSSRKLCRNYADFDILQKDMVEVPSEAIPTDHPDLGDGEDGYGALTYILAGALPVEVLPGSPLNAGYVGQLRERLRPSQPIILWGS